MEKRRLRFHENWGLFWRASRTPPPGYSLTATLAKGRGGAHLQAAGDTLVCTGRCPWASLPTQGLAQDLQPLCLYPRRMMNDSLSARC